MRYYPAGLKTAALRMTMFALRDVAEELPPGPERQRVTDEADLIWDLLEIERDKGS